MWTTILILISILVTFDFDPHNFEDRFFSGIIFSKNQNMDCRQQIKDTFVNEGLSPTDCQSAWNIILKALILNEN